MANDDVFHQDFKNLSDQQLNDRIKYLWCQSAKMLFKPIKFSYKPPKNAQSVKNAKDCWIQAAATFFAHVPLFKESLKDWIDHANDQEKQSEDGELIIATYNYLEKGTQKSFKPFKNLIRKLNRFDEEKWASFAECRKYLLGFVPKLRCNIISILFDKLHICPDGRLNEENPIGKAEYGHVTFRNKSNENEIKKEADNILKIRQKEFEFFEKYNFSPPISMYRIQHDCGPIVKGYLSNDITLGTKLYSKYGGHVFVNHNHEQCIFKKTPLSNEFLKYNDILKGTKTNDALDFTKAYIMLVNKVLAKRCEEQEITLENLIDERLSKLPRQFRELIYKKLLKEKIIKEDNFVGRLDNLKKDWIKWKKERLELKSNPKKQEPDEEEPEEDDMEEEQNEPKAKQKETKDNPTVDVNPKKPEPKEEKPQDEEPNQQEDQNFLPPNPNVMLPNQNNDITFSTQTKTENDENKEQKVNNKPQSQETQTIITSGGNNNGDDNADNNNNTKNNTTKNREFNKLYLIAIFGFVGSGGALLAGFLLAKSKNSKIALFSTSAVLFVVAIADILVINRETINNKNCKLLFRPGKILT